MGADAQLDEKEKVEKELSAIEARARVRRRASVMLTFVPLAVTSAVVLGFASDIRKKRTEVAGLEEQKKKLDEELREQQDKLKKAEAAGEDLDGKIAKLREEKKVLEDYLRGQREKTPENQAAGPSDVPESVVLAAEGEAQQDFRPIPRARVKARPSGRSYDIFLSLDVPEGNLDSIAKVTYELNPLYYFVKREIVVTEAPFGADLTVYACKSTVLIKIELKNGAKLDVDYDWCRAEGWPAPKQEQVEQEPPSGEHKTGENDAPQRPRPGPEPPRPRPPGMFGN